jgi:phosphosulfolactate synthase (CoM biosynthesis protein A)
MEPNELETKVIMSFDLTDLQNVKMDFTTLATPEDYVMLSMSMLNTLIEKAVKHFTELGHKDAEKRIRESSTALLASIVKNLQTSDLPMVRPLIIDK